MDLVTHPYDFSLHVFFSRDSDKKNEVTWEISFEMKRGKNEKQYASLFIMSSMHDEERWDASSRVPSAPVANSVEPSGAGEFFY
jgi:hypothetical protein